MTRPSIMLEKDLTGQVIGGFYSVYRELGFGFLESNYRNALAIELGSRGLKVRREVLMEVQYRGATIGKYRIDMIVEDRVLVEVKSTKTTSEADERQLLNYLKATDIEVGLLLHFGPKPLYWRRVYTNDRK